MPGSFEDETLLICIIYIQEEVHQSIPNADTGLPWCTSCWNSPLVYSFNIKLQVSGSSWWGGVVCLIRVRCLCQVHGVELTCPLVHCSDCLLTFPMDCVSRFGAADYCFLGKVYLLYRHIFYHLTGTSSNHTVSARSSWSHWLHILPRIINYFPVLW